MLLTQNSKFITQNSIDFHCHLLPRIDDGPADLDESIAMAWALADAGFTTVCCTPHRIRGVYDNTADIVRRATRELQEVLDRAEIPLVLVPGMEYYLDEFLLDALADPLLLPGNVFLVEASPRSGPRFITETLYQAVRKGLTPLIAHPERCNVFTRKESGQSKGLNGIKNLLRPFNSRLKAQNSELGEASLLHSLAAMGCKFQGNLGSFAGRYGGSVRQAAEMLREAGVYTHFGSDAHAIEHIRALRLPPLHDLSPNHSD